MLSVAAAVLAGFAGLLSPAASIAAEIDFAHEIVPVLKKRCAECHAGSQSKGHLSINTRESLLAGGEGGPAIVPGKSGESELISRITSDDPAVRMPPEGEPLTAAEISAIKAWIDQGARWDEGLTLGKRAYEPPLEPRRPELPPAQNGQSHPLDRILNAYWAEHSVPRPALIPDAQFVRRAHLDLIGLLPTPEESAEFEKDASPDKRERLVSSLLERNVDYAEHWLTFWNDLLRNDYSGTGFITGGRKQISRWLYQALASNMPYNEFARQLIAPPTPDSAGFIEGIRWRGDVSAGQTVEIQFAQSVAQSFLGINLKCASCHDSFIDRWTLDESYGLAAVYSTRPLEIHRCDQPTGHTAKAGWLFPRLGAIDGDAPQPDRLKQLASLMTHADNGRFTRTIVNRLWHRLMGRGIVHPTDAMQTPPWSADLLDYLAVHLADHDYDLKQTLELIATSHAYQMTSQAQPESARSTEFLFRGPQARRLTAEQFLDALWQITDAAPTNYDAPVVRFPLDAGTAVEPSGTWIWASDVETGQPTAAGRKVSFRKTFVVDRPIVRANIVLTCDNEYTLFVNKKSVHSDANWMTVEALPLAGALKDPESPQEEAAQKKKRAAQNEIVVVAVNAGNEPNPAGLYAELHLRFDDGTSETIATDETWEWTPTEPNPRGVFPAKTEPWRAAAPAKDVWSDTVREELQMRLAQATAEHWPMVRSGLLKADFLMRSLGRPNRDQIVSMRPEELSTLEAIDLTNGTILADTLAAGSRNLAARKWASSGELVDWVFRYALSRAPQPAEREAALALLGEKPQDEAIQDLLWAVVMLPEFQTNR